MAINENDLNQEKAYLNIVNKELKEKISDIGVSLYQQEEKINEYFNALFSKRYQMLLY